MQAGGNNGGAPFILVTKPGVAPGRSIIFIASETNAVHIFALLFIYK
jgi:hypothetical protein